MTYAKRRIHRFTRLDKRLCSMPLLSFAKYPMKGAPSISYILWFLIWIALLLPPPGTLQLAVRKILQNIIPYQDSGRLGRTRKEGGFYTRQPSTETSWLVLDCHDLWLLAPTCHCRLFPSFPRWQLRSPYCWLSECIQVPGSELAHGKMLPCFQCEAHLCHMGLWPINGSCGRFNILPACQCQS